MILDVCFSNFKALLQMSRHFLRSPGCRSYIVAAQVPAGGEAKPHGQGDPEESAIFSPIWEFPKMGVPRMNGL